MDNQPCIYNLELYIYRRGCMQTLAQYHMFTIAIRQASNGRPETCEKRLQVFSMHLITQNDQKSTVKQWKCVNLGVQKRSTSYLALIENGFIYLHLPLTSNANYWLLFSYKNLLTSRNETFGPKYTDLREETKINYSIIDVLTCGQSRNFICGPN